MGNQTDSEKSQQSWGLGLAKGLASNAADGLLGMGLGMLTAGWQDRRQLKQQQKLQDMQIAGQKEMGQFNQGLALDMWKKTGPTGQKEQLKLAGLNPALMYGMGGGTGGQAQATTGNVSGGTAAGGAGEIQSMLQLVLQNKMTESQIEVNKAQAENIAADTEKKQGVDTAKGYAEIDSLIAGTKNTEQLTVLNEIKEDFDRLQLDIAEHTFNDVVNRIYQESKIATRMAEKATRENRIGDATEKTAINTIRMQYAVLAAEKALKEAQTSNTEMDTRVKYNQIGQILADIQQKWFGLELYARNVSTGEFEARIKNAAQELSEAMAIPEAIAKGILGISIGQKLGTGGPKEVRGFRK